MRRGRHPSVHGSQHAAVSHRDRLTIRIKKSRGDPPETDLGSPTMEFGPDVRISGCNFRNYVQSPLRAKSLSTPQT
jgi:hypothetical protein